MCDIVDTIQIFFSLLTVHVLTSCRDNFYRVSFEEELARWSA